VPSMDVGVSMPSAPSAGGRRERRGLSALRPLATALALALAPTCLLGFLPVLLANSRLREHRLLVGELLLTHPYDLPHNRARRYHLGRPCREVLAGGQVVRVLLLVRLHDRSFNILRVRLGHVAVGGRRLGHLGRLDGAGGLLVLVLVLVPLALVRAARGLDNRRSLSSSPTSPVLALLLPTCSRTPPRCSPAAGSTQVRGRSEPTAGSVARLHGGSRRVRERVARALPGGRDIVAGARAVCRARRRTRERGEGEKRPLLFIAQKVKKGDFTVIENWSSTALLNDRPPVRARTYRYTGRAG